MNPVTTALQFLITVTS